MSFQEKNNWLILIEQPPKSGSKHSPSDLSCFKKYVFQLAAFLSGLPARVRAGIAQCQDLNQRKRTDEIALVKSQQVETAVGISNKWISIYSHPVKYFNSFQMYSFTADWPSSVNPQSDLDIVIQYLLYPKSWFTTVNLGRNIANVTLYRILSVFKSLCIWGKQ